MKLGVKLIYNLDTSLDWCDFIKGLTPLCIELTERAGGAPNTAENIMCESWKLSVAQLGLAL